MKLWWMWFLARFRLSEAAICEMSRGKKDYHDYFDTEDRMPWHFCALTCKRCGKQFYI